MPHFFAPLDMHLGETRNVVTQNLSVAPTTTKAGLRYYDTTMNRERYWTGTTWLTIDLGWTTPTAPVDFGNQRIINLAPPTAGTDAANKDYVDSVATGLDWKNAARAGTTANINLASPGAAIDGVTLAAGDRVLVKNQTTGSENGLYRFVAAASPMVRTNDADTSAEVTSGLAVLIVQGTTLAGTQWVLNTPDPIVVGTTALTFVPISTGALVYVGTTNRITVTGNVIDIAAGYTGQASITTVGTITAGTWQGTAVGIAYGGTGATTAAGARTALSATGKYVGTIAAAATTATLTHNLGTTAVQVELFETATGITVYADVTRIDANNVKVDLAAGAPALTAVVVG